MTKTDMKILIISIYDGAVGFSVYDNGKIYDRDEIEESEDGNHKFYELFILAYHYKKIRDLIEKDFINDYDKIFICEDGDVEVVK